MNDERITKKIVHATPLPKPGPHEPAARAVEVIRTGGGHIVRVFRRQRRPARPDPGRLA